jgi:hypothetical protein
VRTQSTTLVSPLARPPDHRADSASRPSRKRAPAEPRVRRVSKKNQIRSLYTSGITDVEELAIITDTRPSYVARVLQDSALLSGYFDLYTTTARPMNVHSKLFARRLGFKNEEIARRSVKVLEHYHRQFQLTGDCAGQHHALSLALTMFNRARWTGKAREAAVFRAWLVSKLDLQAAEADAGRGARF